MQMIFKCNGMKTFMATVGFINVFYIYLIDRKATSINPLKSDT